MADILIAATCCVLVSFLTLRLSVYFGQRFPKLLHVSLAVVLGLAVVLSVYSDRLFWADWIPSSTVFLFARSTLVCMAAAVGLLMTSKRLGGWQRQIYFGGLLGSGLLVLAMPLLRYWLSPLTVTEEDQWNRGVCMQSTEVSCCPAAAVTLLATHGARHTESSLTKACLTSSAGTSSLGLYRGLSQVAADEGMLAVAYADLMRR